MSNVNNLIAINSQGETFTIELGGVNSDSIMSVYLISTNKWIEDEFATFDIINKSLVQDLSEWGYKVVTKEEYAITKM